MFYIKTPDGLTALHILEDIAFTRLEYLEALFQNKSHEFVGNIEYLIEDSTLDSIGHFLLRLFASTSTELFSYWLERETLFFKNRLEHLLPRQVHRLLRRIRKYTEEENNDYEIDRALIKFSTFFLQADNFYHIVDANHSYVCEEYKLQVDFNLVPDLIKERQVELAQGQATIFCSQWKKALVSFFQTFIYQRVYGNSLIKKNLDVINDPRLASLNIRVQNHLLNKGLSDGKLTFENINTKASSFPPCMRNLHNILRSRHRLTHHARFYYTLFLKECGMKINDVIQYWKQEYSKPHLCGSACTHNWQNDERKFVYSIRHMYGLEGNKRNYKAQSCRDICKSIPGSNFEGGCPFNNFDVKTLEQFLKSCVPESEVQSILEDYSNTRPEEMCKKFLLLSNNNVEQNFDITSPIQYFTKCIEKD